MYMILIYKPTCTTHAHSQEKNQEIKPPEKGVEWFNVIFSRDDWWYCQKTQKVHQVTPEVSFQEIPAYQGQTCQ